MIGNRLFNALMVGLLASATSILYAAILFRRVNVEIVTIAGVIAFVGASCAGYLVVRSSSFSGSDAVRLFVLGDLFAFLAYMFWALTVRPMYHEVFDHSAAWIVPPGTTWHKVWTYAAFYVLGFVAGNLATGGIGFVMMLPPVLLLAVRMRYRTPR